MTCKGEGATHYACECVLAQLRAADELAKAVYADVCKYCVPHSVGHCTRCYGPIVKAMDAYEKLRGKR